MWPRRVEIHVVDEQNKSYVVDAGFLSDPSLIIALPVCPWVSLSLSPCCENWLVPRPEVGLGNLTNVTLTCEDSRNLPKSHAISPCLTSCCKFWQPCCWHWNKTKAMLLVSEQNKRHVVDAGTKQKTCCWCCFFIGPKSKSLPCLVSQSISHSLFWGCWVQATSPCSWWIKCWIFQNCYMDFSYL